MNHSPSDTGHPDSTPDTDTAASEYPTTIEDPSTGARITFLERGIDERGTYLLVEGVLPPRTDGGPARLHPRSEARSEVVDGRAVVTVRGEETVLLPGESVVLDAGDPHTIRNGDERHVVVRTTLRPPGEFETAIRTLYGLGAGGRPNPLSIAAVLYRHREDVRLASVPWRLQLPILRVLTAVARALGRDPT